MPFAGLLAAARPLRYAVKDSMKMKSSEFGKGHSDVFRSNEDICASDPDALMNLTHLTNSKLGTV